MMLQVWRRWGPWVGGPLGHFSKGRMTCVAMGTVKSCLPSSPVCLNSAWHVCCELHLKWVRPVLPTILWINRHVQIRLKSCDLPMVAVFIGSTESVRHCSKGGRLTKWERRTFLHAPELYLESVTIEAPHSIATFQVCSYMAVHQTNEFCAQSVLCQCTRTARMRARCFCSNGWISVIVGVHRSNRQNLGVFTSLLQVWTCGKLAHAILTIYKVYASAARKRGLLCMRLPPGGAVIEGPADPRLCSLLPTYAARLPKFWW